MIKNKKDSFWSYLLIVLIIVISSRSTSFSYSIVFQRTILVILGLFLVFYKGIKFEKNFLFFTLFFFIYSFLHVLKFNNLQPESDFFFFYVDVILFTYFSIKIIGERFFHIFEKVVFNWSLLIFPIFLLQLLIPKQIFGYNTELASLLNVTSNGRINYVSSILFTMNNDQHLERNSGFMWEPGAFGAILIIAFMFHLYFSNKKLNVKTFVYIIIIFSTYSTTAYLNCLLLFLIYNLKVLQKNDSYLVPLIIVSSIIIIFALQSEILFSKIFSQIEFLNDELSLLDTQNETVALGRFASLIYLLPVIINNFFLGIGWNSTVGLDASSAVNLSNGLAFYFAMFGILGFLYMLYNVYLSMRLLFKANWGITSLYTLVFLNIGFSNPVLLVPLFMVFQLYHFVDFKLNFHRLNLI